MRMHQEDQDRVEHAVRELLGVLGYDPDDDPGQIVACCNVARRELVEWRGDWTRSPRVFEALLRRGWPGLPLGQEAKP